MSQSGPLVQFWLSILSHLKGLLPILQDDLKRPDFFLLELWSFLEQSCGRFSTQFALVSRPVNVYMYIFYSWHSNLKMCIWLIRPGENFMSVIRDFSCRREKSAKSACSFWILRSHFCWIVEEWSACVGVCVCVVGSVSSGWCKVDQCAEYKIVGLSQYLLRQHLTYIQHQKAE